MEEPVELTFQDVREITDDFSEERIVGAGGFGIVYKGVTKHGVDVAVKILRRGSNPDLDFKQFQNEFYNLMKVKHENIVQFLGYCYEIETTRSECNGILVRIEEIHGALCFEYMHNGSLKNHLSDESSRLDWHTRYKIIKGTCEGLRYIHQTESLLHLDLKPDNILLDQDMVPKIADFGLSKIFGDDLTRTTKSPLGTPGFQPPEFIDKGEISEKFDIFSLGVIIIKIVSGPEGYPKCQYMPSEEFIDQVKGNWRKRWQTSSIDSLLESAWCRQVETCTKIALLNCLEKDSQKRPHIVKIINMLNETETNNYETYGTYGEHDTFFTMHDLVHDLAVSVLGDRILYQSKQGNDGGSICRYALLHDSSKPLESWTTFPDRLWALHFLNCQWIDVHGAAFELGESLRVLDLSKCSIQKLPDSIGLLKRLRYLNAPRLQERMLPECITKLSKLMYLSLRGSCYILELPESIGEMEGLVHLDLSGCLGIKTLPASFGNLTSLEHVDFANCKNVTGVSKCLASFTKLQHLNLSNCERSGDLPRAFGSLTELQYLNLSDSSYLSGNKLTLPEYLGSLTKLKYLLGSLTKLKYLNLSSSNIYVNKNQRIISSPEAFGSLTELKYLNLSHHCFMGKLLPSFGNLCNLVHLDLSYCHPLRGLPGAFNGLTKLQYLDLYNCFGFDVMEWLQDAFGNLSELRHLNLGCCIGNISYHPDKINALLGWICNLTNLEYLSLRENGTIYSIPETLANLRKLHTLDLSFCSSLQRLPASISEIESLKFLYTMECRKLDRSTLPSQCTSSSRIPPHFVAHTGDGESSSYVFQYEDGNPARIKISRLENVKSAGEARTIKPVGKTHITQLALEWTRDAKRLVEDAEVLRELEPPHSISIFRLRGYNSVSFPSWVHFGAYLPHLTVFEMRDLPKCNSLPPLGQLPNLEDLDIGGMDSIKEIGADLYGGPRAFPRLENFRIHGMKWLTVWNTELTVFPCLSYVSISDCPGLRFEGRPPRSMEDNLELSIYRSDKVMLSSWENIGDATDSTVTTLEVISCLLPLYQWRLLRHLPCLQVLTIEDCSVISHDAHRIFFAIPPLSRLSALTVRPGPEGVELCGQSEDCRSIRLMSFVPENKNLFGIAPTRLELLHSKTQVEPALGGVGAV